jgi:hypothetical protein
MDNINIIYVIIFLVIILGVFIRIKLWTSPHLERWLKRDAQGPFVPLPKDETTKI